MKKLLALSGLALLCAQSYAAETKDTYIMVDVGSSSSKVYFCDEETLACKKIFTTKKGMHHYKHKSPSNLENPTVWKTSIKNYMGHLIKKAIHQYRASDQQDINFEHLKGFYAYATAGMRSVTEVSDNPQDFQIKMDKTLKNYFIEQMSEVNKKHNNTEINIPFEFKTLTGTEEAAYAWLALNAGKQPFEYQELNEMGGFSMQYATSVEDDMDKNPNLIHLNYKGSSYYIKGYSYFLGVDRSWEKFVPDNYTHSCIISEVPSGDIERKLEQCEKEVKAYIDNQKIEPVTSSQKAVILTGGGYEHPLRTMELAEESISVEEFKKKLDKTARQVCSMSQASYIDKYIKNTEKARQAFDKYHQAYCFNLVHYKVILEQLKLPASQMLDLSFSQDASWLKGKLMTLIDTNSSKS